MSEERKNNQIVQVKSNSLAKVSNTLVLTDKLLQEIDSRNILPRDDFRIPIPDWYFRRYLINKLGFQITNDTVSYGEIKNIEEINCGHDHWCIESLKGIEYFSSLLKLGCWGNHIIDLDVSQNTALTYLSCGNNRLTELDVSQNTALTSLECNNNQLTGLNVSQNTALTYLSCGNNRLTELDVSQNTALTRLRCQKNQLTKLDIPHYTTFTELWCQGNQLTDLGFSHDILLRS